MVRLFTGSDIGVHGRATQAFTGERCGHFFEEWHEPLISGIQWCSELVELVGEEDVFAETRTQQRAQGRIVTPEEAARRTPEVVIASWCGRKASPEKIRSRRRPALRGPQPVHSSAGPRRADGRSRPARRHHPRHRPRRAARPLEAQRAQARGPGAGHHSWTQVPGRASRRTLPHNASAASSSAGSSIGVDAQSNRPPSSVRTARKPNAPFW